jgi:hypothetical protein
MKIVVVYLGNKIPEYIWANIEHLLLIQREYEIDLVTSELLGILPVTSPRLTNYAYKPDPKVYALLNHLDMDTKFRDGFWRFSLERLFALTQHHEQIAQDSILHIEGDILLLPNFPFRKFSKFESVAWSKVDSTRDVASLIFLPSMDSSRQLHALMSKVLGEVSSINDMTILRRISSMNSGITNLPTANSLESSIIRHELHNASEINIQFEFDYFEGIFDPGSIGIWLTGSDPRNYFGITKKFDTDQLLAQNLYINPAAADYSISSDGILKFHENSKEAPIYCLHIHSKNISYFKPGNFELLSEDIRNSSARNVMSHFSLRTLVSLLWHNFKKGTLLRYLYWIPALQNFKKIRSQLKN